MSKGLIRILGLSLVGALSVAALMLAAAGDSRVANAAMQGDIKSVRAMLAQKADVNGALGDGMTALHWAAYKDDFEMAQVLINAGANAKAVTRIGSITPLSLAAKNGNAPFIDALLKAGASATEATSTGATVLMAAALSGNAESVKLLIDRGANVNAKENANGQTALMFAAWENRAEVIRTLVQHGADITVATKVLDLNAEPRYDDDGNIIAPRGAGAAGYGNRGGAPDAPAGAAPASAAPAAAAPDAAARGGRGGRGGDDGPGASSFMGGMTALLFASRDGNLEAVQALVESGANVDQVTGGEKSSPLVIAIANGHFTVAKYLLDKGANPNLVNIDGLTPLYAAVNMRYAPVAWAPNPIIDQEKVDSLVLISALLDRGADANAKVKRKLWFSPTSHSTGWVDNAGTTAFWRAAQSTDVDVMKMLVARGADPNLNSNLGVTPLMVASGIGWIGNFNQNAPDSWLAAVKYCIELGNDVNAIETSKGYTALHGAASRGDNDVVKYLVEKGAKVDIVGKDKNSVADMAFGPSRFFLPRPETVDILVKFGSPWQNNCRSDQCVDGKFNGGVTGKKQNQ